ncbi:MAG: hypothetical protein MPJ06_02420, partial [Nitrosopumilus sp.]|nr:hypothetical protein [Nitrosopumilus sp.]
MLVTTYVPATEVSTEAAELPSSVIVEESVIAVPPSDAQTGVSSGFASFRSMVLVVTVAVGAAGAVVSRIWKVRTDWTASL